MFRELAENIAVNFRAGPRDFHRQLHFLCGSHWHVCRHSDQRQAEEKRTRDVRRGREPPTLGIAHRLRYTQESEEHLLFYRICDTSAQRRSEVAEPCSRKYTKSRNRLRSDAIIAFDCKQTSFIPNN